MNIANHIDRGAREHPDRPALVFEGRQITYGECARRAAQAAEVFLAAGIAAGDRIALFLPNVPDFAVVYLGALKIGAIAVAINSGFKLEEAGYILADCGVRAAVTCAELRKYVPAGAVSRVYTTGEEFDALMDAAPSDRAARPMRPEDPAAIVYTSGTTARAKGATLSHDNVVRNIEAKKRYLGITANDRALLFLPLYHCFGQNAVFNAMLHAGATVVLHRRFDPESVLRSIAADRVSMFFGVPATYQLLLDRVAPQTLANVRFYFSAAAPLPIEIEKRWQEKFGTPIFQGYGLTETSPFASYNHIDRYRPGSVGTAIDGVEMTIVDPLTGAPVPSGQTGEIAIRGHNVMLGYWNRPDETARAIRDGWFRTGDIGRADPEGYFYIEDRLDDTINSGGVNIYPAEIENVLYRHPAVAEAAVYGAPEALLGEQVWADIVKRPDSDASPCELRSFCADRLAASKAPAVIQFVEEIPKSPAGKVLKRVLRERAKEAVRQARRLGRSVGRTEAQRWMEDWLRANMLSCSRERPDCRAVFADLGMDSVLAVRLAMDASDWLGRDIAVTAAWSFPTAFAFAAHLAAGSAIEISDEAAEFELLRELELLNR